ncbi:type I methionyl aminopeptidase [Spirosoma sp. KUDC1026]|uniref:type I methionyl aminopeptidase n=1 Tax=Spirosoma sp. KUDC1026 TaxID=2745947 RepID=UPI00159BB50F|nr:type I methionyl aminopeptidase [Spirosoma sp. KUDC1026]QKZ12998.1 type I methionyl aminopeptidase [Spirosoma sp. KUDC1026]
MSLKSEEELIGMQRISQVVGSTLKLMQQYAKPGMSTFELDQYGRHLLEQQGARSAPKLAYDFPGWTCISVNDEACHGIPSTRRILLEGDLVNIDVSAELGGYWSDNGGSFILGKDIHQQGALVEASKRILAKAISHIRGGVQIAEIGRLIETEARRSGYRVIKNLAGHGIGRSLHEEPHEILCYYDRSNKTRFRKNSVVAIETFLSTKATYAHEKGDGWTLIAKDSFAVQHEHTIVVTDKEPIILTAANQLWN